MAQQSILQAIRDKIALVLPELSNTSATSIWRRIVDVFSTIISFIINEIQRTITIISTSARSLRVMGKQWYIDKMLEYQEGDNLVIINEDTQEMGYNPINIENRIVKQCAIREKTSDETTDIYIYGARIDPDTGRLAPFTAIQLDSIRSYMKNFYPIGINFLLTSPTPDIISCTNLYIRYSKNYNLEVIQTSIIETLTNFELILRGDVPLYVNAIESALCSVAGIEDAYFNNPTSSENGTGEPQGAVNGILPLPSGYFLFSDQLITIDSTQSLIIYNEV